MNKFSKKKQRYIIAILLLSSVFLLADCLALKNYDRINRFFSSGVFNQEEFKEASLQSDGLARKIEEEGIVLLKNEKDALPLAVSEGSGYPVNLFGFSSCDCGNVLRGIGTGYATIDSGRKVTLSQALEEKGFLVNQGLLKFYEEFHDEDFARKEMQGRNVLYEPGIESYPSSMLKDAEKFSDTSVMVLSRVLGENCGEAKLYQEKVNALGKTVDNRRHYLELSVEEEGVLQYLKTHYSKVIVLINSTNPMELGFLDDNGIQAALDIGVTGQSGMRAVADVLSGDVTPSGRLTDSYLYDLTQEPSFLNYKASYDSENQAMVHYAENIYVGYRYYETLFSDGDLNESSYRNMVLFPFGYGLSYTEFLWKIEEIRFPDTYLPESEIEVSLSCENIGNRRGKDVIFLFAHSPYSKDGIEKPSSTLIAFSKSASLNPGEIQKGIHLTFSLYQFASYDCFDKNQNGFKGYELEKGSYSFSFQDNSHDLKKMESPSFSFELSKNILFEDDLLTGEKASNLFTGNDSYGGGIDGSGFVKDISYLSRKDFKNSYPKSLPMDLIDSKKIEEMNALNCYDSVKKSMVSKPVFSKGSGLRLVRKEDGTRPSLEELKGTKTPFVYDQGLLRKIAGGDDETLQKLVSQMSKEETKDLVEKSGFGTAAIDSISKPMYLEYDGTCGLNKSVLSDSKTGWTAFPSMTVLGQTFNLSLAYQVGESLAEEGKRTGVSGIYAPSGNLHRSSFNGRNGEYFSEDPFLTGHMAGNIAQGAKSHGFVTYMKHFVMAELGDNCPGVNEFNTEQALREIYLRPFEIAVKEYQIEGLMSSFNRIGAVWTGASYPLLSQVLRKEWGYQGVVISDYSDGSEPLSTRSGILAGNDLWLNERKENALPLDMEDDVYMKKAQESCMHYLHMLATVLTYQKKDTDEDDVSLIYRPVKQDGFPLWMIGFVLINSLFFVAVVGVTVYVFFKKEDPCHD